MLQHLVETVRVCMKHSVELCCNCIQRYVAAFSYVCMQHSVELCCNCIQH